MTDLTDGAFYKKQRQTLGCRSQDITLTVNADGSPVFKSSNYSIWPVHLTINELPPHIRWRNVICALLWYGTKHPDMTILLEAFAEQMKELSSEGIHWSHNGEQLHSKVCKSISVIAVLTLEIHLSKLGTAFSSQANFNSFSCSSFFFIAVNVKVLPLKYCYFCTLL